MMRRQQMVLSRLRPQEGTVWVKNLLFPSFPSLTTLSMTQSPAKMVNEVKSGIPSQVRVIRRFRYKQHVRAFLQTLTQAQQNAPEMLRLSNILDEWDKADNVWPYLAGWTFAYWWVAYPLIGIPLFLILGFGAEEKADASFQEDLLPVHPEDLINAMNVTDTFVLVEGPKGTAKSTLMRKASKRVWCSLYLLVEYDAPSQSNYALHYIGSYFYVTEFQARMSLRVLRFIGAPLHVFFDVETSQLKLQELTKHIKSVIVDQSSPLIRAAVASSDGKTAFEEDPRMTKVSTEELSVAKAMQFWENNNAEHKIEPELLQRAPRTPLFLSRVLPKEILSGKKPEEVIEKRIAETELKVMVTFRTCKDRKGLFTKIAQKNSVFDLMDVARYCGDEFAFASKPAFVAKAVQQEQLFRPVGEQFAPQFDLIREAFRRSIEAEGK